MGVGEGEKHSKQLPGGARMLPGKNPQPELWLRPSPTIPLADLLQLIQRRELTRTPRLGARDESHPKGYTIGQPATLRLVDASGKQQFAAIVIVTDLINRRLFEITPDDLAGCGPWYRTWRDVEQAFAFFENRMVFSGEPVTIVEFTYSDDPSSPEME
jgi:hypothetical protein